MNLCNLKTIREILSEFGTAPKKSFGQNFLISPSVPERIAANCCDRADSVIVEIGPGIGCLTAELAKKYNRVIAIELDETMIPILARTLAEYPNVTVLQGDILKIDLAALLQKEAPGAHVSVCANLPYYITTPILMYLLESQIAFDSITVMVQAEVASRLTAAPGSAEYGAITASVAYFGLAEKLFTVAAGNFYPAPKVDSAVVRINLYKEKPVRPKSEEAFFKTIRAAFGQRRKTLVNALSAAFPDLSKEKIRSALEACGLDERVRGERLPAADFAALSDMLFT